MSAYRTMLGFGMLDRATISADAKDLPFKTSDTRYTPKELVTEYSTVTSEAGTNLKWHRFGANISDEITYNRNVNILNDLGTRYYTVTTVGRFEPSMTISGLVSYEEAERWMRFAFNCESEPTVVSDKKTYVWTFPTGAQTFDIAYIQANKGTNGYAGYDEYHIMTGCAINSLELSYEVGADMGFRFSLEIMGLSDFWEVDNTGITESNISSWFDPAPSEVFTAGCVSLAEDPSSEANAIAQTDKGVFKLENFLSYRGACGTTYASGYSIGTMNFTFNTDTYSNDPAKYERYFYGYDSNNYAVNTTMCPTKQIKPISTIYLKTSNSDPEGNIPATKSICIKMEDNKITSYNKSLSNTGDAIMDSPEIRPKKASIILYKDSS